MDRQDLLEHVASLRPEHATDQAADARRTANAIENLNGAGLLVGASTAEQFEVSPAVDVVLPLEKLQELLRWLQSQNSDPGTRVDPVDLTAYADTDISDEDAR